MNKQFSELIETDDHYCVLNTGGLLLISFDKFKADPDEEVNAETIARDSESVILALPEVFRLAALIETHRATLEAAMQELDAYFIQVARAWLDECVKNEQVFRGRNKYWWPGVRHEAWHILIKVMNDESNPVITAWKLQARNNQQFPREQQEELLFRHLKRLYYERFPVPERKERE